jgi:hypothetical protein
MPSGHKGVFMRMPNAVHKRVIVGGRVRYSALPIKQLYGPSIGGAYSTKTIQQAMAKSLAVNFNRRLAHEINRLTKGST